MSPDRYVEAFRRAIEAPASSRDRNLAAIEKRIAAGDVVDEDEDEEDVDGLVASRERVPTTPHGRWASALFAFKAVSLSVGLGVAGLGVVKVGAMTWSAIAKDEQPAMAPALDDAKPERGAAKRVEAKPDRGAPERVPEDRPAEAPPVEASTPEPVPPSIPAVRPEPRPLPATPPHDGPRARPRAKTPPSDRLREEVDLMTRMRAELDAGRHDAVLALVAQHERDFSDGAMIEERRAWQAIATCSLHRAHARAQADAFLDRHPRSSLAEKVRRACANRSTDSTARSD